jgi:hypothetical protein
MNHACQSAITLNEMLSEAAGFVCANGPPDIDLTAKLETLRQALCASDVVSAEVEHEIVSLREVARFKRARATRAER